MSESTPRRWMLLLPRMIPFLVMAIVLVLYLGSRSVSLDDFDSYSFVLALDHFDLRLQQPQPPGFPVYVLLGRLLSRIISNPRVALTTLSALSGTATVGMLYVLVWMFTRRRDVSAAAAVLFALSPIQWLASGKALSDTTGLALALAALAALWSARTDHRWLPLGAAILGLSLGVRPQSTLPGLLLVMWVLWDVLRAREWRTFALALAALGTATLLWLAPTARAAGGLGAYQEMLSAHSQHVWKSDSLFGAGPLSTAILRARIKDSLETFLVPTLGISVYEPLTTPHILWLAALVIWILGGLVLADYRRIESRLLVIWFLLVFIPYFLFESLNRPRLMLPCLPPLTLLTVSGWARLPRRLRHGRWVVWGTAALVLFLEGRPLASALATVPAPPAQAANYIREHYPADQTLVAAAGSFRAAQVGLPGYRLFYLYQFDAQAASAAVSGGTYRYVAILDRDVFGSAIESLDAGGRYVPVDDRTFSRDPRVHWQHSQVRLQVLMPSDQIGADQLRLPPDGRIDIGGADDGRFLGQGWFRGESVGGVLARWAGDGLTSGLRVNLPAGTGYQVTLRAAAYPAQQTASIRVNGQIVAQLDLAQDWRDYSFTISADLLREGAITTLTIIHTADESPYERTQGGSSDRRRLAAAYDWIQFKAQ